MTKSEYRIQRALGTLTLKDISNLATAEDTPTDLLTRD